MLLLDTGLLSRLKAYDPSIELHFNTRLCRWVVLQRTSNWYKPTKSMIGVQEVGDRDKVNLKFLFTCEHPTARTASGRKVPIEPTFDNIVETLEAHYPPRGQDIWAGGEGVDPYSKREREVEEHCDRELRGKLDDLHSEFHTDRKNMVIRDRVIFT